MIEKDNVFCIDWDTINKIKVHKDIIIETCSKHKDYYMIDLAKPINIIQHPEFQILHLFYQEVVKRGHRYVMFYDDKSAMYQQEYNDKKEQELITENKEE